ncbi:cysteine desulfurase NifS [Candidatus Formimonas warabiya]|uniref:Cysteine desulfurase IscS n=1 Tax=Formimonas warabiya TaxID=1761012 RepID=A0A3G1KZK0_FORW1|nr:cysteine desulfurase NifS [Candidatus Formimonas warabiya]ATW27966.1 cysteine desulfurase NifS [Candidatus Formimonas warabiya]
MKRIYMDHGATTPLHPEVISVMSDVMKEVFGNPSSLHYFGREAKKYVDEARQKVADLIGAKFEEIYFTGGGTEADNIAVFGTLYANSKKGRHIITSSVEHHAVLDSCIQLAKAGYDVTFLPVDQYGMVDPDQVKKEIRKDTVLISVMHANNENGTIEPVEEISEIAKEHGVFFHTDCVQTVGKIPVNVDDLGADLLTLSAHKIYGPKGIGALYKRKGVRVSPLIHGGGQEKKLRSGTENTLGIIGFGKAAELAARDLETDNIRVKQLRDKLIQGVMEKISDVRLNGHPEKRLPHNAHFSFAYVEGESLLLSLDMKGVAISSGSACSSRSLQPSHVLVATGLPQELVHGSIRITLGRDNTEEDIDYVLNVLPEIVARFRSFSPLAQKKTV